MAATQTPERKNELKVQLINHSATRKGLEVKVPAWEVSEVFGQVIARIAKQVKLPGFRPGKAPRSVLMSKFQREIVSEVAQSLVDRHFWNAAAAAGTQPISNPALEKADLREGVDGSFKALFDVAPEVQVPEYKGLAVPKKKRRIDDAAVEEHLEGLRERAAKLVPVEEAASKGLYATLDIKVKPQGMKPQSYQDQVIQLDDSRPFDQQLIGLKVDDKKAFDLDVPAEDPNRNIAGKKVHYEVVLKDLRKREVPVLNDEFAKDLDKADLKALKAWVREDLEEAAERDAVARMQTTMLDMLLDAAPFEVPASMVSLQLDDYCQEFAQMIARQGINPKRVNWNAYRQARRHDAERAVRSGYLLQAIGNAEDIQVSDEEIDAEIRAFMDENKVQQSFEAFKAELERRGNTTEIKGRLRTDKIFERMAASAKVDEELLDKAAFEELVELERKREAGEAVSRFDAGGLEGGDLSEQEGGEPASLEHGHVHGPDCDHDHAHEHAHAEAAEAAAEEKPKKAAKKTAKKDEDAPKAEKAEEKPKKAVKKKAE
jgi:trigger factor